MSDRLCTKCNEVKDESNFYTRKDRPPERWCKECKKADSKKWREANPEKYLAHLKAWRERNPKKKYDHRGWRLRTKYGLTVQQWNEMFERQGRRCAICKADTPEGSIGEWHIDHDHATKINRGILCGKCNLGLGLFNDDPKILQAAIFYLKVAPAGAYTNIGRQLESIAV